MMFQDCLNVKQIGIANYPQLTSETNTLFATHNHFINQQQVATH